MSERIEFSIAKTLENQILEISNRIHAGIKSQSAIYLPYFPTIEDYNLALNVYKLRNPRKIDMSNTFGCFLDYKSKKHILLWYGISQFNLANGKKTYEAMTTEGELVNWQFVDSWKTEAGQEITIHRIKSAQLMTFDWKKFLFNSIDEVNNFAKTLQEEIEALKN